MTLSDLFPTLPILAAQGFGSGGLTSIDWAILLVYASSTIYLGWYFGKRQKKTSEYFTGSGQMNPILIGVSLFASLLSTITYLSLPGETIGKGPIYLTNYLAYPFIFLLVGFVILPIYMRNRVTSAYELLEDKLGLGIRLLGASMFLVLRLVWMSLLIYLTATAICTMIGIDGKWVPLIVFVTGAVSITYSSLGGLRAVVVTDLMQSILLYGGAVLIIGIITVKMDGFGWFPTEWNPDWDRQPVFSLDPGTRVTVFGTFLSVLLWYVATSCGDQVSVQRFMATKDAKAARRALGIQLIVASIVGVTLGLAGFSLLGWFQAHPEAIPDGMSLKENADQMFPHFIAYGLPPVVSGLVLSGLFAAAMSSIDSGINSITAVVTTDFLDRFGKHPLSEKKHVLYARLLAVGIGAVVVIGSSFIQHIPGNITAVTNKTVNLLPVPIFCLFFFAFFVKFARPAGVWAGAIAGTVAATLVAFSGPIFGMDPETGLDPISFQWIAPVSLVTNLSVGCLVSALFGMKAKNASVQHHDIDPY